MDPEMTASENTIDIHRHLANIGIDTFDYRLPQEEEKNTQRRKLFENENWFNQGLDLHFKQETLSTYGYYNKQLYIPFGNKLYLWDIETKKEAVFAEVSEELLFEKPLEVLINKVMVNEKFVVLFLRNARNTLLVYNQKKEYLYEYHLIRPKELFIPAIALYDHFIYFVKPYTTEKKPSKIKGRIRPDSKSFTIIRFDLNLGEFKLMFSSQEFTLPISYSDYYLSPFTYFDRFTYLRKNLLNFFVNDRFLLFEADVRQYLKTDIDAADYLSPFSKGMGYYFLDLQTLKSTLLHPIKIQGLYKNIVKASNLVTNKLLRTMNGQSEIYNLTELLEDKVFLVEESKEIETSNYHFQINQHFSLIWND